MTKKRSREQVGDSVVEAMLSRSAPVFYGDLRSHEMVPIPFSTFITSCKRLGNSHISHSISGAELGQDLIATAGDEVCLDPPNQIYLAQVPILNLEGKGMSQLKILREDIQMPSILETKGLASINLWMNNAKSRSSTHYDPHHNLLCIVAGCKQGMSCMTVFRMEADLINNLSFIGSSCKFLRTQPKTAILGVKYESYFFFFSPNSDPDCPSRIGLDAYDCDWQ
ncbi:hypothetical protein GIB67_027088 [Kingdonia uniflora]|uniref:Cupin-like domain-containing protein n=1 Tax=Kingdonia uniflora TaxID=39325 RepID=A0A7J7P248_9MAGN|nr:hypothetical protein GIB67_027088 [Kingdonia uniflora]